MRRTSVALALLLTALSTFADQARDKAIHDATVLVDQGKVDQAIGALTKLVADDPADATAVYELGLAYAAKGDNARCRATLEPIEETKSANRALVLGMLGNCLDQLGESEKAIAVYRRGLETAPDDSGLLFNLAITLIQHGKADEGRELLKRDVEKNPLHKSAHLVLGQVFEGQGFNVPATFSYLHFLAIEPASKRSGLAAEHLSKLLDNGFQKTKEGANLTFDPNARKEEGDYGAMQLMMVLSRAAATDKKLTEFELMRGQIAKVIAMLLEMSDTDQHDDFTARVQVPFFASMKKANVTDAFAGIAISPLNLPGTEKWVKTHGKEISAYYDWLQLPAVTRPAIVLPPKN